MPGAGDGEAIRSNAGDEHHPAHEHFERDQEDRIQDGGRDHREEHGEGGSPPVQGIETARRAALAGWPVVVGDCMRRTIACRATVRRALRRNPGMMPRTAAAKPQESDLSPECHRFPKHRGRPEYALEHVREEQLRPSMLTLSISTLFSCSRKSSPRRCSHSPRARTHGAFLATTASNYPGRVWGSLASYRTLDDCFAVAFRASRMSQMGRLRMLPLPIALPGSRHSRWLAEQSDARVHPDPANSGRSSTAADDLPTVSRLPGKTL